MSHRGGVDEAARALDAGRRTTIDDIVAFARRGRGERGRPTFGWESLTDTEARVAHLAADGLTPARSNRHRSAAA